MTAPVDAGRDRAVTGFLKKQRWWAGRVAVLPVHIAIFALVVFFLVRAIPGDPVLSVTGGQFTPEIYAKVHHALGLDGSTVHQLSTYMSSLAQGRLGNSIISGRSVTSELNTRFPATLKLALLGLTMVMLLSLAASYVAVMLPKTAPARVIRAYARTAGAIPEFCVGIALIAVFYASLHWAPTPLGRIDPDLTQPSRITGMPFAGRRAAGRLGGGRLDDQAPGAADRSGRHRPIRRPR